MAGTARRAPTVATLVSTYSGYLSLWLKTFGLDFVLVKSGFLRSGGLTADLIQTDEVTRVGKGGKKVAEVSQDIS
jgi:hypothetical protein